MSDRRSTEAHRRASVSPWIRVGLDPTWKLFLTCVNVKKEELNRGGTESLTGHTFYVSVEMRLGADQNEVQEQEMLQPAFGSFTWAEIA